MLKKTICICKTCGMTVETETLEKNPPKISVIECNNCVSKRWKKEIKQPKLKQAVLF